ncbi:20270_t:CDS:2, partial [Racocetra persica]
MSSEQKYPGYEELTSYLTRSRDKSFWGFLHRCRDTIVTTTSATSLGRDLDKSWCDHFLAEVKERFNQNDFNNIEKQVSEDRKRYNFEDYWNDVVNECKLIKMKEDELTRILNKRKIHPKDSSNLDEDLITQSSSAIEEEEDLIAMQSSSAIDENSTAMQSSSAIDN